MLVAKLNVLLCDYKNRFENYVNYAGSKTLFFSEMHPILFENYVNYAGSKTDEN